MRTDTRWLRVISIEYLERLDSFAKTRRANKNIMFIQKKIKVDSMLDVNREINCK